MAWTPGPLDSWKCSQRNRDARGDVPAILRHRVTSCRHGCAIGLATSGEGMWGGCGRRQRGSELTAEKEQCAERTEWHPREHTSIAEQDEVAAAQEERR